MLYQVNMKHPNFAEWQTFTLPTRSEAIAKAMVLFEDTFKVRPEAVVVVDGTVHARYGRLSHPAA